MKTKERKVQKSMRRERKNLECQKCDRLFTEDREHSSVSSNNILIRQWINSTSMYREIYEKPSVEYADYSCSLDEKNQNLE